MAPDRVEPAQGIPHLINEVADAGGGVFPLAAWRIAQLAPGAATHPSSVNVDDEQWLAASAPGTVAAALRAAGRADTADSTNLDDFDWWYRCDFRCPNPAAGGSLEFAGLATLADVWVNGNHVLSSNNMFVTHVVDVGASLAVDNEVVIRFRSLNAALKVRRPRPRWRSRLVSHQGLRWFRTTLLGHMPSWSPSRQPVGPWRSVSFIPRAGTRITASRLHARIDSGDGVVAVHARISTRTGSDVTAATVRVGSIERAAVLRRSDDEIIVSSSIRVPEPRVWWPHTHGAQPMYDATLTLTIGDTRVAMSLGRVAFRTLELATDNGDFDLRVNGTRIFWRGACWSPIDTARLHGSLSEYRRTLQLARDAGMNMLRVGGTMVNESDDFYNLCDELGIAVWQDLMFANMDYPASDAGFRASAELEVTQILERVCRHPSLVLVCGNSEVEQQAAMLGLPESEWRGEIFSGLFANISVQCAPGVPYWQSSPSGGALPFHVDEGDGHYFGYGPYLRDASDVRASRVRFASECLALSNVPEPDFVDRMPCGAAGAGHHPDWKRGVTRDAGAGWDFEDVRDHYVKELFGVDPAIVRYADPERYLALGRVAGGELIRRTISEWRRADSTCNGALVWLYRDLYAGAGWGILDVEGSPKAAYYHLARSFRPVAAVLTDEGLNGVRVNVVNDLASGISATLTVTLFKGSVSVGSASVPLRVDPHSSVDVHADQLLGRFTDISCAYRFGRPNHDSVVVSLTDCDTGALLDEAFLFPAGIGSIRAAAQLSTSITRTGEDAYELTVGTDELALAVAVEAPGWTLSDNYFHVAPGGARRIRLAGGPSRVEPRGRVHALNARTALGFGGSP
jgi:beta-mannosidase